jgi:hypothetical protein
MPARPKRFMRCGHVGYGEYCHRCEQAELYEKKAEMIDPTFSEKEEGAAKAYAEFREKATHLRGPSKRTFERRGGAAA